MSARILYVDRTDTGAQLAGARVVGSRVDERWTPAPGIDEDPAQRLRSQASGAADWLARHLDARPGGRRLDRVVLDADGALCAWLAAPSADRGLAEALIREQSIEPGEEAAAHPPRFPDLPGELSVDPLGPQPNGSRRQPETDASRVSVIVQPDIPARILLDRLDDRRIQTNGVLSIWHAAAAAWDPSAAKSASSDQDPLVQRAEGCTAIVLLEPEGRLLWCWSIAGRVVAAGHARTPADRDGARLRRAALGRLGAEWLAWSAQLGLTPNLVRLVASLPAEPAQGELDGPGAARLLGKLLPDAAGELIDDPEPIGLTLRRLAEAIEDGAAPQPAETDGRDALASLAARPGRAHRRMYRAAALALVAGAALAAAGSLSLTARAGELRAARDRQTEARQEIVSGINETLLDAGVAGGGTGIPLLDPLSRQLLRETDDYVGRMRSRLGPGSDALRLPRPALEEVNLISRLVASEEYRLRDIRVGYFVASFEVSVPDTAAAERLQAALRNVGGSNVIWQRGTITRDGDRQRINFTGRWDISADLTGAGGTQ